MSNLFPSLETFAKAGHFVSFLLSILQLENLADFSRMWLIVVVL